MHGIDQHSLRNRCSCDLRINEHLINGDRNEYTRTASNYYIKVCFNNPDCRILNLTDHKLLTL
jgi:hypothetical protein